MKVCQKILERKSYKLTTKITFPMQKRLIFLTLVWVREVMSKVDGGDIFSLVTFVAHSKFPASTLYSHVQI